MKEDALLLHFAPRCFGLGVIFLGGLPMQKNSNLKKITIMAVFCALAYLCMFAFRFKVSFLTFDFKDAVLSVLAFMFGPVYGVCASAVVAFL